MTKPFKTVGILGAGTMGKGIAQVCALHGYQTILYDVRAEQLQQAMAAIQETVEKGVLKQKLSADALSVLQAHLSVSHELSELQHSDLIIEAVPEDLTLKQALFMALDRICPLQSVFASNTSSISITALAAVTQRPSLVAGLHFFNPVHQMKLVEVIQGKATDPEIVSRLSLFAESLGKTPVKAQDTPGFIVNRVARAFYGEALRLLGEGVADHVTIDAIMREEGGFVMGPFELLDLIGLDVNLAVTQSVYNAYFQEARFKPHPIQEQMVAAGYLGRKTKHGFYTYD